jgi:hypothetical protein
MDRSCGIVVQVWAGKSTDFRAICVRFKTSPSVRFEKSVFWDIAAHAIENGEKTKNLLGVLCV